MTQRAVRVLDHVEPAGWMDAQSLPAFLAHMCHVLSVQRRGSPLEGVLCDADEQGDDCDPVAGMWVQCEPSQERHRGGGRRAHVLTDRAQQSEPVTEVTALSVKFFRGRLVGQNYIRPGSGAVQFGGEHAGMPSHPRRQARHHPVRRRGRRSGAGSGRPKKCPGQLSIGGCHTSPPEVRIVRPSEDMWALKLRTYWGWTNAVRSSYSSSWALGVRDRTPGGS